MQQRIRFIAFNIFIIFSAFLLMEGTLALLLYSPRSIPGTVFPILREYYMDHDRNIIQLMPRLATYDSLRYYRLREGTFTFSNREFSVDFHVNSLGVRDDEASAQFPHAIVMGDSHGMGWGEHQDSTFANKIEHRLGIKVLNTATSSYATVREFRMLSLIKTDSLKCVIIQYCPNDFGENEAFLREGNKITIGTEQDYLNHCQVQGDITHYYPFKHIRKFFGIMGNHYKRNREPAPVAPEKTNDTKPEIDEATAFLNVIQSQLHKLPDGIPILVFSVRGRSTDASFSQSINTQLKKGLYPELLNRLYVLNLSEILTPEKYFLLDDHINHLGHEAISRQISIWFASIEAADSIPTTLASGPQSVLPNQIH